MSKGLLLAGLFCLCFVAVAAALYPFRKNKWVVSVLLPIILILTAALYWHFGGFFEWARFLELSAKKQQVQAILQSTHGVEEVIAKLKAKLSTEPNSAQGWYLLGRLYAHQGQWDKAKSAFNTAHDLNPDDALITMNLVQSLLQLNQQTFNEDIRTLIHRVLQNDPNQPDALAMVAMDAYQAKHYRKAIDYWRKLLKLAPENSEEAAVIRKAIHKAQSQLNSPY